MSNWDDSKEGKDNNDWPSPKEWPTPDWNDSQEGNAQPNQAFPQAPSDSQAPSDPRAEQPGAWQPPSQSPPAQWSPPSTPPASGPWTPQSPPNQTNPPNQWSPQSPNPTPPQQGNAGGSPSSWAPSPPQPPASQSAGWQPPQTSQGWSPQSPTSNNWQPAQPQSPAPQGWQPQQAQPNPNQWASQNPSNQPPSSQPPGQWAPAGGGQGGQPPYGPNGNVGWSPQGMGQQPPVGRGGFVLGPLTVADILDLTFSLLRKAWKPLFTVVLIYAVPLGFLTAISSAVQHTHSANGGGFIGTLQAFSGNSKLHGAPLIISAVVSILALLVSIATKPYISGAITRLVAAEYLGREMTAKEALIGVRKFYWRFLGASLLVDFCLILGIFPGVILLFTPAIAMFVLFSAVTPIIAIEEDTATNAMGRSWALMKRRFWSYLLIRIVLSIIASICSLIVEIVPLALSFAFFALHIAPLGGLFYGLTSVAAAVVDLPIAAITVTLIYFDARVRHEGFDLQMMAVRMPYPTSPPNQ